MYLPNSVFPKKMVIMRIIIWLLCFKKSEESVPPLFLSIKRL